MSPFTEDDRDRLREALIEAGRDRFSRYGLRKTTIGELTDDVGIAQGTFYQFFDSKAELYLAVIEREAERVFDPLVENTLGAVDDPERALEAFLRGMLEAIETNDLARSLLTQDEYALLRRKLPAKAIEERRSSSVERFLSHIIQWQEQGVLPDEHPETIANAIRSVAFLALHREEIGEDYEAARDVLIRSVAAGLTREDQS
ncbi:TetR/AcrR family transcriptional regulator [Halorhabdus amylolytica]|uniref:TetR/AcrR family transcriptional regulator n=1 Tax=Halorhabdus amylolytica TaxID=2559573 RepID=UPI0010AB1A15|nr:TetR/AcrR family transcriptional regulator [Halorhabdus amylolytica]